MKMKTKTFFAKIALAFVCIFALLLPMLGIGATMAFALENTGNSPASGNFATTETAWGSGETSNNLIPTPTLPEYSTEAGADKALWQEHWNTVMVPAGWGSKWISLEDDALQIYKSSTATTFTIRPADTGTTGTNACLGGAGEAPNKYAGGVSYTVELSAADMALANAGNLRTTANASFYRQESHTYYHAITVEFFDENGAAIGSPVQQKWSALSGAANGYLSRSFSGTAVPSGTKFIRYWFSNNGSGDQRKAVQNFGAYLINVASHTHTNYTGGNACECGYAEYGLWVGGVQVTSDNAFAVTGANIVGSVTYDAQTKTLSLNNATVTWAKVDPQPDVEGSTYAVGIYSELDSLTVSFAGTNTVYATTPSGDSPTAIHSDTAVTLQGADNSAKLILNGESESIRAHNLTLNGNVEASDCINIIFDDAHTAGTMTVTGGRLLVRMSYDSSYDDTSAIYMREGTLSIPTDYQILGSTDRTAAQSTFTAAAHNPTAGLFVMGDGTGTVGAKAVWIASKLALPLAGSGTESDPYLVAAEADLRAAMASTANATNYIKFTGDITAAEFIRLNETDKPMVLDLGGYTLDLKGQPLILNNAATVKNGTVKSTAASNGYIIYCNAQTGNTVLSNLNAAATSGSAISIAQGNITISNCVFAGGNVSYNSCAGLAISGGTVTADNVTLSGKVAYQLDNATLTLDGQNITVSTTDTEYHTHGDANNDYICDWGKELMFSGSGTESDPYLVANEAELRAAMASTANATNYIKISGNITVTETLTLAATDHPMSLDLGGYTLSGYADILNLSQTATVKNGTVTAMSANKYSQGYIGIYVQGGATVTVDNCKINSQAHIAIYLNQNANVTVTNSTLTSNNSAIYVPADATANIENCTLSVSKSDTTSTNAYALYTIYGTITANKVVLNATATSLATNYAAYCVSGGTLYLDGVKITESKRVENYHTHIDEDLDAICDIAGDLMFSGSGTESDPYLVANEAQLNKAISLDVSPNYIKLDDNITASASISITGAVYLDLNGKTLDLSYNRISIADDPASLTVLDSSATPGSITGTSVVIAIETTGGFALHNGNITTQRSNVINNYSGTVEITGGSINNNAPNDAYYCISNTLGTLNISGGNIVGMVYNGGTMTVSGSAHLSVVYETAQTIRNKGTLIISGGTITSPHYCIDQVDNSSATLTITGGTLSSTYNAIDITSGYAVISGGNISAASNVAISVRGGKLYLTGAPVISGGEGFADISVGTDGSIIPQDQEGNAPYTGDALTVKAADPAEGAVILQSVTTDTKAKFTLVDTDGYLLIDGTEENAGNLLLHAHADTDSNAICDGCGKCMFPGSGTEDDPYLVSTEAELKAALTKINETAATYIKLADDIICTATIWLGDGYGDGRIVVLDLDQHALTFRENFYIACKATVQNGKMSGLIYVMDLYQFSSYARSLKNLTINGRLEVSNCVAYIDNCSITTDSYFGQSPLLIQHLSMVEATNVTLSGIPPYGSSAAAYSFANLDSASTFHLDGKLVKEATTAIYYHSKHTDDDSNGFCDEANCGALTDPIGLPVFYSITLGDNIGVNIYMALSAASVADSEAYMLFTLPNGKTVQVPVPETTTTLNGKEYYKFSCGVAVKEMTADIKAQFITSGGNTAEYTCTVEEYAKTIIANADGSHTTESITLAKALLNYGAAAQIKFNYKVDVLANRSLDPTDQTVATVDAEALKATYYKKEVSAAIAGVTYTGSSTVWETSTKIRHYFTVEDGANITFKLGETDLTPQKAANGSYYVEIEGIVAKDMNAFYTLTVSNGTDTQTITYSVYSYFYDILAGEYSEASKNGVKAAYHYAEAAIAYLESKNNNA